MNKIIHGDSLIELKSLPENSVDSIVTDPPYELGFMGKSWDNTGIANNPELWKECLRVLKPGGHLLSFGGTRTYHRMAVAIEDAGFEVRDMIEWVYGSGFPKSHNIGKAVDKISERLSLFIPFAEHYEKQRKLKGFTHNQICEIGKFYNNHNHGGASSNWSIGANVPTLKQYEVLKPLLELSEDFIPLIERVEKEREIISSERVSNRPGFSGERYGDVGDVDYNYTKGTSEYEGWGTALKPAHEPICMARKPLSEKTVATNVLKWGTGGINIDESRVEGKLDGDPNRFAKTDGGWAVAKLHEQPVVRNEGRFPANLIHDNSEEVRQCFPESTSGARKAGFTNKDTGYEASSYEMRVQWDKDVPAEKGNASRFFKSIIYQSKASKSERNKGCDGLEEKVRVRQGLAGEKKDTVSTNSHPTVKPIALMEYLIKMVTPKGGTVLDPFAGSGTTLVAAKQNGFQYVGIEMTEEYIPIIEARLSAIDK